MKLPLQDIMTDSGGQLSSRLLVASSCCFVALVYRKAGNGVTRQQPEARVSRLFAYRLRERNDWKPDNEKNNLADKLTSSQADKQAEH